MKQRINFYLKKIIQIFVLGSLVISVLVAIALAWLWPRFDYLPTEPLAFSLERLSDTPIIDVSLSEKLSLLAQQEGSVNINGPSMIRVPDWVENPLGKYYLYFSHYKGDSIRLAYADEPQGPWQVYEPGALSLRDSGFPTEKVPALSLEAGVKELWDSVSIYLFRDSLLAVYQSLLTEQKLGRQRGVKTVQSLKAHIASPDVIVDNKTKQLVMFFHGQRDSLSQVSAVAVSSDGLNFKVLENRIAGVYLRSFDYQDNYYLLAAPGVLYRSDQLLAGYKPRSQSLFGIDVRHSAVFLEGNMLTVVFSRMGDAPERLLLSTVDLSSADWNDWKPTQAVELLRAEKSWEGADLAAMKSHRGEMTQPTNDLRDPDLFVDTDGQKYLLYVGGGEQAIGIARLNTGP